MTKNTIKLNNDAKLILKCSTNEMNDVIITAVVTYRSHEQFNLGYVVINNNSNMCEPGYFYWDNKNVYLCDDCDNCYQIFNYIEKQFITDERLSQYVYKRSFKRN